MIFLKKSKTNGIIFFSKRKVFSVNAPKPYIGGGVSTDDTPIIDSPQVIKMLRPGFDCRFVSKVGFK